jgi:aspartate kinase
MFSCLGEAGINIEMISTSEIKISCAIPRQDGPRAVRAIHDAFELERLYEKAAARKHRRPAGGKEQ